MNRLRYSGSSEWALLQVEEGGSRFLCPTVDIKAIFVTDRAFKSSLAEP